MDRFSNTLLLGGQQKQNRNISRCSLPPLEHSAWNSLCNSGDDGASMTVTGFDHAAFQFTLGLFAPLFDGCVPFCAKNDGFVFCKVNPLEKRGRPRQVTAASCLGLALAWFRFRGGRVHSAGMVWFYWKPTQWVATIW